MPILSPGSISLMMDLHANMKKLLVPNKDLLQNVNMFIFDCNGLLACLWALILFNTTLSFPLQDLVLNSCGQLLMRVHEICFDSYGGPYILYLPYDD